MKRFAVLALSGLAAVGVSACGNKTQPLTLVGHSTGSSSLTGPVSTGDQIKISEQLTRNGQPYGTDSGGCIADTQRTAYCSVTLKLPGGTVDLNGHANLTSKTNMLTVGQGTGKYLRTSGFAQVANTQANDTQLTVHLEPY